MPKVKTWPESRVEVDGMEPVAVGFGFVTMTRISGNARLDYPIKGKVSVFRNGMCLVRGKRYNPDGAPIVPALAGEVDRMFHLSQAVIHFSFPSAPIQEGEPDLGGEGQGEDGGEE